MVSQMVSWVAVRFVGRLGIQAHSAQPEIRDEKS